MCSPGGFRGGNMPGGFGLLGMMGNTAAQPKHKVFVSYHHKPDQGYRDRFEELFARVIMISKSVQIGDIDPDLNTETIREKIRDEYLSDSTVTVVLVGAETWQRKHVDWEIASSIRDTKNSSRSGLLGILLPTYRERHEIRMDKYNKNTIPPRLSDNIDCGFAKLYNWDEDPKTVKTWIQEAFDRRFTIKPDNSRESFVNNRSGSGWS